MQLSRLRRRCDESNMICRTSCQGGRTQMGTTASRMMSLTLTTWSLVRPWSNPTSKNDRTCRRNVHFWNLNGTDATAAAAVPVWRSRMPSLRCLESCNPPPRHCERKLPPSSWPGQPTSVDLKQSCLPQLLLGNETAAAQQPGCTSCKLHPICFSIICLLPHMRRCSQRATCA